MGEKLTRFFLNTLKNSAQNFERIIMTATKGESSTEKKKSWASIFKRTMSFSNLSRNDKDNTNGQTAASSSSTSVSTPAKSQSVSRQSRLSLTSKRGSLDSTSSITSFNSTYNSRRSSQPPQEFWW